MLTAHIDKEIVIDAYTELKHDPIRTPKDFIDFIREGSDLKIYGKFNEGDWNIISDLLQGRQESKIECIGDEYSSCKHNIDQKYPYQVFFLNLKIAEKQESERKRNHYLCGFIDDYKDVFKSLSKEAYFRVNDYKSGFNFKSWNDVLPDLPITEIIISDPYLLADDKDYKPIEENYFKLLHEIASKYRLTSLLVIAPKVESAFRKKQIIAKSKEILGSKTIFGLIGLERIVEHDRYIFMNYNYINTGSSTNYFDKDGKVSVRSASKIEIFPLSKPMNFTIAQDILRKLKSEMEFVKIKEQMPAFIDSGLFKCLKEDNDTLVK